MATHRVRLARAWLLTVLGLQEHGYSWFGGVAMLLLTEPTKFLKFKNKQQFPSK
jgi:hypothetical protein